MTGVQTCALPILTLAFYSKDAESSGAKRTHLLDAIFRLIKPEDRNNRTLLQYIIEYTKPNNGNNISVTKLNQTELKQFEKKISDALVALKLALRTYEQKK